MGTTNQKMTDTVFSFASAHPRFVFLLRRSDRSTSRATATLLVRDPTLNEWFEVLAKVRYMERLLADDSRCLVLSRGTAVPTQAIFSVMNI
jgi:hypothetical protein